MNYGFEIYVDRNRIRLTEDLLRPLSASSGTTLYGIHNPYDGKHALLDLKNDAYPGEESKIASDRRLGHQQIRAKAIHDFVITTVPFELWPSCVAGRLDIKHRNGILERVLTVFKNFGLNILHLRCTRSGHHYTTVSFVAHLIGLETSPSNLTSKDNAKNLVLSNVLKRREKLQNLMPNAKSEPSDLMAYAHELKEESTLLKNDLLNHLGSKEMNDYVTNRSYSAESTTPGLEDISQLEAALYWDSTFDRTPVGVWALKNLAYFYAKSVNQRTQDTVARFEMIVSDDWSIAFKDPEKLAILTNVDRDLPSVGFASLDTETHIIRLAILSPGHLESFRSVNLSFRFVSSKQQTFPIGALHDLANAVSRDWNIWRIYNKGGRYEPEAYGKSSFLTGQINLIMEYQPEFGSTTVPSDEEIRNKFQNSVDFEEFTIKSPIAIKKFSSRKIFVSLKGDNQLERAPEILEICKDVGSEFGFLPDNVRTVENYGVNSLSEEVARTIYDSSGLIQFLMSDESSSSFTWIESEFLLATVYGLPTVRIVDPRLRGESRFFQDKAAILLPEFASSSRFRAAIRKAFKHIVDRISDTGLPLGGMKLG